MYFHYDIFISLIKFSYSNFECKSFKFYIRKICLSCFILYIINIIKLLKKEKNYLHIIN